MYLIRPCAEYLQQYREAIAEDEEFRPDVEQIFSDPDEIIEKSYNFEQGINLPSGYVRSTRFWAIDDDRLIGEIDIRHELSPFLLRYGGHIGYEIRYSEGGKGYGTRMLALALKYAKSSLGIRRVLITCDDDNCASIRVIEKNGGILENKIENEVSRGTVLTRRYWIDLS